MVKDAIFNIVKINKHSEFPCRIIEEKTISSIGTTEISYYYFVKFYDSISKFDGFTV